MIAHITVTKTIPNAIHLPHELSCVLRIYDNHDGMKLVKLSHIGERAVIEQYINYLHDRGHDFIEQKKDTNGSTSYVLAGYKTLT